MSVAQLNRAELVAGATESATILRSSHLEAFVDQAVAAWLELLARNVLETGVRVVLPGFGTFYRATWAPTARGEKRGSARHRLAFKAATKNRGRPL